MYYDFLWSDPESDPDNLIGSGSGKKVWIRADPDPQHCMWDNYFLLEIGIEGTGSNVL